MRRVLALCALIAACGGSKANTGGAKPPDPDGDAPSNNKKGESTIVPVEARSHDAQLALDDAEHAFAAAGNDCAQLCKALGSMTNATDRLCELAKENGDDKRCDSAKGKLDSARAKVKATCGECS